MNTMSRQIINSKQQYETKTEYFNGRPITFSKDSGYTFSDNPAMDATVDYFLSLEGFELASGNKKPQHNNQSKKVKNVSDSPLERVVEKVMEAVTSNDNPKEVEENKGE